MPARWVASSGVAARAVRASDWFRFRRTAFVDERGQGDAPTIRQELALLGHTVNTLAPKEGW